MAEKPPVGERTENTTGTGPRAMGMYDRPASADRKMPPLAMILAIVAVLALLAWLAFSYLM